MLSQSIRHFSATTTKLSFAKAQVLGTVGAVYFKESQEGKKFINYSLAVNKYQGTERQSTDWFNVSVFNENQIKTFEKILKPGMQLFVEANLNTYKTSDEVSGKTHNGIGITQRSFEVVKWGKKDGEEEAHEE